MSIKYLGTKNLDEFEVANLKNISEKAHEKFKTYAPELGDIELAVHVKKINEKGRAKVFSVVLNLFSKNNPSGFDVAKEEWDLKKALHSAFEAMESYVAHSLKKK